MSSDNGEKKSIIKKLINVDLRYIFLAILAIIILRFTIVSNMVKYIDVELPENIIPLQFDNSEAILSEKYKNFVEVDDKAVLHVLDNGVEKTVLFDLQLGRIIDEGYIPREIMSINVKKDDIWVDTETIVEDINFDGYIMLYSDNGRFSKEIDLGANKAEYDELFVT